MTKLERPSPRDWQLGELNAHEAALVDAVRLCHPPAPVAEDLLLRVVGSHRSVSSVLARELRGRARQYAARYQEAVEARLRTLERLGLVRQVRGCCPRATNPHWVEV